MPDLITTLHPINDDTTDLYPNVKNENIPPVVSGKDAMEALEGDFSTLKTDELQVGGENGTLINKDQIITQNKVINLDEIVDDAELAQGLNGKVDKVSGKGLSTNDYTNADKALVDTIPDKVNKEQGKGLSTNDFTNEYKKDLDQDIPEQIQLFKDAFEEVGTAINGKVDKVSGKGLSTNDFTNADKVLVATIPNKVDKVQGKGLSTNDYTNANKTALELTIPSELSSLRADILNLYRMVIRSGEMITVTDASVALTSQNFPLTVSPKALLNYVGGMCQKLGDSIITAPVTKVVSKDANGDVVKEYPIPAEVRALDGYGMGISASVCNYVDFETKKFVKKVAVVDLSTLYWMIGSNGVYFADIPDIKFSASAMCSTYQVVDSYPTMESTNKSLWVHDLANRIVIKDTDISDTSKITGTLVYELANPVETDISDFLRYTFPTYDIINVLPGGYLEFQNDNNIGVPYSVTYQYKRDAQTTVQTIAPTAISEVDSNDPTDVI